MTLDEVFENKETIASEVGKRLEENMTKYGFEIVRTLVNDIDPDKMVKEAMNQINTNQRIKIANEFKGEAEKVITVKAAEAQKENKILQGQGIAGERLAIVEGLNKSITEFQAGVPGSDPMDVMRILLMTQWMDTLKSLGADARSKVIILPGDMNSVDNIYKQLTTSFITGKEAAEEDTDRSI
jgi:regulator of protease activity HflC (stomatin/prohibitin superfamily)